MNKHIVQLIRERFYPLVCFCGPQSAGEVEVEGVRATVYLGELSIWFWPAILDLRPISPLEGKTRINID